MLFAERWNSTPFEIMKQDIDDFILIANNLIQKNANKTDKVKGTANNKEKRIKVNDKTATGGWW